MDFFEQQETARHHTKLLLACFILAVVLTLSALYLAVAAILRWKHYDPNSLFWLWDARLFGWVALGTLSTILIGCVVKIRQLAGGGSVVAAMLGGRWLDPNTSDPDERKLVHVVEEMAIASGIPVPEIFLLAEERSINAFAAGHSPSDAAIGVTKGCMKLLSRDELQAIIAHEFSHILNGDMRLNLRLMGLVFGLLCLPVLGRILLQATRGFGSGGSKRGGAAAAVAAMGALGLALLVIGSIGAFFGRLIKSAISRQREFLADAAAVQFTRNPEAVAGALKKIGGLSLGSRLIHAQTEEASHLFFANGMAESWWKLLSTHPPLAGRIRAIEPGFDGKFATVTIPESTDPGLDLIPPIQTSKQPPLIGGAQPGAFWGAPVAASMPAARLVNVASLLPRLDSLSAPHLQYAANFRANLPELISSATHEAVSASGLIYALLLSSDSATRTGPLQQLQQQTSPAVYQETVRLWAAAITLAAETKLPLILLTLPALRRLSPSQYTQFTRDVQLLVQSDHPIKLFEYMLQKIILRHLDPHFRPVTGPIVQYYALRPLIPDCALLLSALAYFGNEEAAQIESAFQQGVGQLNCPQNELKLLPAAECGLSQIDAALNRLAQAVPQIKKTLLNASASTVAADGIIRHQEAELLRAIADALDCPIPPVIEGV